MKFFATKFSVVVEGELSVTSAEKSKKSSFVLIFGDSVVVVVSEVVEGGKDVVTTLEVVEKEAVVENFNVGVNSDPDCVEDVSTSSPSFSLKISLSKNSLVLSTLRGVEAS